MATPTTQPDPDECTAATAAAVRYMDRWERHVSLTATGGEQAEDEPRPGADAPSPAASDKP